MLYIVMLIFQLVGALILLFNTVNGSKEKVISNCFLGNNCVIRDNDDNCVITKDQLIRSANQIFLNITAFADLLIGYFVAALSPTAVDKKHVTVIAVVLGSILLSCIEYYVVKLIAKNKYQEDEKVSYSDLEKIGVNTTIKNSEVDEIIDKIK